MRSGGHSSLVLSKASGKEKIRGRFRFPAKEERQIVGTAGRRLLSDLCFYFSFEVISFYSIFHITCFLMRFVREWEEGIRKFCSQGPNWPFVRWRSFYYTHLHPSGFCFLVQVRASLLFKVSKTGNKKRPTCFATFLQNELNSDAVRFTNQFKK